jgi:hypothetical protein
MHLSKLLKAAALVGVILLATAIVASAQTNKLTNPGFEAGLTGWTVFGNAYAESSNPAGGFVPCEGNVLVSMFGNWSGPWNVSGIFQEFATSEGEAWRMKCKTRHWGGDPMIGIGPANDNWMVQKIAFFDAANAEIGFVESIILDGTFATDVCHDNAPIVGYAPAGTVKMQALILYIQPASDGGAGHVDDVELYQSGTVPVEEGTWGSIKALYN